MRNTINIILSVVFAISIVILTITVSIGLPIYVRPFYYAHVDALDMPEDWGLPREYIIEAYDEVLDFLTLEGREFGSGVLPFSEAGKGHFEDCKVLFDLNRDALIISLILVVALFVLHKLKLIKLAKPFGFSLSFFSGVGTLVLFAALGIIVAQDFSEAFRIFHTIFFPGKDNWMFDPYEDPIILFMPQEFFMNCAILICASILVISAALIVVGIIRKRRNRA